MSDVFNFSYSYFELEGVPPYTSHFVPVDFWYQWWIDKTDSCRFRFEKHFLTRNAPQRTGPVALTTSLGEGNTIQHTEYWNNAPMKSERQQSATPLTFSAWFARFTAMGRKLVEVTGSPDSDHRYLGLQTDEQWGTVHVFQKEALTQASDLYLGMPLVVTHKIHAVDYRWVEMEQRIAAKEGDILHRLWRLQEWTEQHLAELPAAFFEHGFVRSLP